LDRQIEAGLIIHQIENINTGQAFQKVQQKINNKKPVRLLTYLTRIAAVLTLPLLVFTIWTLFFRDNISQKIQNEISWQELSSPAGLRSQIILPDGTKMWLNAQSKVRYSIPFVRTHRTIALEGEAFLEVIKNSDSPFVVESGNTSVEVLGTKFNVKAYPNENNIEVALKEGKVRFNVTQENQQKHLELTPGDFMVYNRENGQASLKSTNIEKYIAWHNNVLILDETPMEEVAVLLQRWYGVMVIIGNEELKKYKFTTTFENESLFRVLELLQLSSPDIEIKYTPGKINSKTGETNQSTVLITLKK